MSSLAGYDAYGMMGSGAITVTYLIAALISFFLALFLYRFATKAKDALARNNESLIVESFSNLRNYFQFNGILLIICLAFIALGVIVGMIGGIVSMM